MRTIKEWLDEAADGRPMTIENLYKIGETYARRCKADKDLAKDDLVWARKQRKAFMDVVWYSCMREIKPQDFNPDDAALGCSSTLQSFYSNEINVDKYSPPAWRRAVIDWLIQAILKNKDKWIKSRYEFQLDSDGRKYVKRLW